MAASASSSSPLSDRAQAAPRPPKDVSVQGLRGLAVLLLVASHVYGLDAEVGLRQPRGSFGHYLTESVEPLRMPLFTVISGYVYALRPLSSPQGLPGMVRGKARRLLLPLLVLTAVVGGLQVLSGSGGGDLTWTDVAKGYLFGYSHLWFLYAIFWVFLVAGVLDATGRLGRVRSWAAAWAAGALVHVLVLIPDRFDVFSLDGALQLFPFFLLGYALRRHEPLFRGTRLVWASAVVFALSTAAEQVIILTDAVVPGTADRALDDVVATSGLVVLFRVRHRLRSRPLAWVGTYAFTIYLLHTTANAGLKTVLGAVGVDSVPVLFSTGLAAAVLLPVLFHLTAGRNALVRTFVLGEKPVPAPMAPPAARGDAAGADAAGADAAGADAARGRGPGSAR